MGELSVVSHRKLRAMYGKWVEALYSYDVQVWESHVAKSSSCRGSESPCRLAASLVAKAKVYAIKIHRKSTELRSVIHSVAYNNRLISSKHIN